MDTKIIWSIVFVLLVVGLCLWRPNAGRFFLGFFYLAMAVGVNLVNAFTDTEGTIRMGQASLLGFYRDFFTGVVSKAPVFFILAIALFELAMGLLILGKGRSVKLGLAGTAIFLLLITPFGYIQIPWLGIAAVQVYLMRKDFNKTFIETVFRRRNVE